ncbi:DoxX family protein [Nocardia cyriacigeorgica]|uniref:DoxX family protein n=1 Tax=Nocardia cyriacigeorgica TaxID=135487 RepID=A0A6P1CYM2_9NOCA|nr:DoxX family protein [Nocardia cyriacigeorgica]NEW39287.1 DoxX family protein [Nocardia cyriacigeorgica]NEW43215.1 DoxX family protein [Nocardia cyriacigeorgica]NEW49792.1 DoxX family protein [Nocardia cyriacigeorgica]NEW54527.1 DoxX family protein [Nocardia cyriacigeorgica]
MATLVESEAPDREQGERAPSALPPSWHPATRALFRFVFVYLGIGTAAQWLLAQLLRSVSVPETAVLTLGRWWSLPPLTDWFAANLFGIEEPLGYAPTGSGDTVTLWVAAFSWLVVATVATAIWTVLDRRRIDYRSLDRWFRVLLRFALAGALMLYGMVKVMPSQMTFALHRLIEPFGDMTPMGVLWSQTAASKPYEIALGCTEIGAGLLLILPATVTAGAALSTVAMAQVFLLNMTFDVPVKLFSFHMLALSLALLAPASRRLATVLFSGKAVPPAGGSELFSTARSNRFALIAQVLLGLWLLVTTALEGWDAWHAYGAARPRSPLYGVWNVAEYSVAGQQLPPLLTDPNPFADPTSARLRRLVFDTVDGIHLQGMDDRLTWVPAAVDPEQHTITLFRDPAGQWKLGSFTYVESAPGRLVLDGTLGIRKVRMVLESVPLDQFALIERGFHWTQPSPHLE